MVERKKIMGIVRAVCVSEEKGTEKIPVAEGVLVENHGILGDAHAGNWHRQVSLLSKEKVDAFNERGGAAKEGAFGENLLVEGMDFRAMPVGTRLSCRDVILELTQIGKECHSHCAIYKRVGDCIMPREGVFAKVIRGGCIRPGDRMEVMEEDPSRPLHAAVITVSDKGYAGERVDTSGPAAVQMLERYGYEVVETILVPDEQKRLERELIRLADSRQVDLILTSGGTGFSARDRTPEATLAVAERLVPGIAEAIRAGSMEITKRAMLGRGQSVLRKRSLIVNLPGSPRAVTESLSFVMDTLEHGIRILRGEAFECARSGEDESQKSL